MPVPLSLTTIADEPLDLVEVKPETLHHFWPFIDKGLKSVIRKVQPDWIEGDIYAALRGAQANAVIAVRGGHYLGFSVYYKQPRPFSLKPELFIWATYTIPLKERRPNDNVPAAFQAVWRYLERIAIYGYGTRSLAWISTRKGFERQYGWRPRFMMFSVEVDTDGPARPE